MKFLLSGNYFQSKNYISKPPLLSDFNAISSLTLKEKESIQLELRKITFFFNLIKNFINFPMKLSNYPIKLFLSIKSCRLKTCSFLLKHYLFLLPFKTKILNYKSHVGIWYSILIKIHPMEY